MKNSFPFSALFEVYKQASRRVPAYKTLLAEAGIDSDDIKDPDDFIRLPVLDKYNTFQRFPIDQLCLDGQLGKIKWVLTSSGHSGIFSFGLYNPAGAAVYKSYIDKALDAIFQVKSRKSLLLNCLPMGVKLYSEHCTMGEVSVRADMALGLVKAFGGYHEQIIFVGEPSFTKHLLELGQSKGIDWKKSLVHVVLGEEFVAENTRKYIENILGIENGKPETGLVAASMGVGELGLNLFFEVPPTAPLIVLRRALYEDADLRRKIIGDVPNVPAFFSYDPERIYVEFVGEKLVITPLDPARPIPMVRYTSDDEGAFLQLPEQVRPEIESLGLSFDEIKNLPIIMVFGRGQYAMSGDKKVYPEQVKEGIYHDHELARQTTANFRLLSGKSKAMVRIQLSPGVEPQESLREAFARAISLYVREDFEVRCECFDTFVSGMNVDYERKFDYLRP